MATENNTPGPHKHDWLMLRERDGSLHVMANASCAVCGLTPEAVANAAAIEMLLAKYAAALEIVRAVAEVIWSSCPWCHRHGTMREVEHDDDCPVLAARAITGITPTEEDNK